MKITNGCIGPYEYKVQLNDSEVAEFDDSLDVIQLYIWSEYYQNWQEVNMRQFKIDNPTGYDKLSQTLVLSLDIYKEERAKDADE